jgi:cysteine synthase
MYSTEKGLQMLREQVPCARLIVAKPVTGQLYEYGLEGVKQELNGLIPNLLPKNVRPQDVPYVTDSEGLG